MGGDHTIALPILRAVAKRHGPVALVHVDAHADVNDEMFGEGVAHGTPFRRAVEEGLLACDKVWQIGLRGTGYAADDFDWPRQQGFTVVQAHEVWYRSLAPLMAEVRAAHRRPAPGLHHLRHRRHRPRVRRRDGHSGDRRPDGAAGARSHPRLPRLERRRRRPRRGRATLRSVRQHGLAGRQPAVRDALRSSWRSLPLSPVARNLGRDPRSVVRCDPDLDASRRARGVHRPLRSLQKKERRLATPSGTTPRAYERLRADIRSAACSKRRAVGAG